MISLIKKAIFIPIFAIGFYIIASYFIGVFYGCRRACVVIPEATREVIGLGYQIMDMIVSATFIFFPISLLFAIPPLALFYTSLYALQPMRFSISTRVFWILLLIFSVAPWFGIYQVVQRANQHPYYWDVVNKGIDRSYLSFISGDLIWYGTCFAIYFFLFLVPVLYAFKSKRFYPQPLSTGKI